MYIKWFEDLNSDDVSSVGGKNASLGEMMTKLQDEGIRVPLGFSTTAQGYRDFIEHNGLEEKIRNHIQKWEREEFSLEKAGKKIRDLIMDSDFPEKLAEEIKKAYKELEEKYSNKEISVAVRSSATAEDLPEASFAGQQETFLNVSGESALLQACKKCYASLFTDRAISYRNEQGFNQMKVALAVGVQKMVRSDKAGAGVMFSIDTETGFPDNIVINASWGLGENVVQGTVNPDEYVVYKPFLDNKKLIPILKKEIGTKKKKMIYASGKSEKTRNIDTKKEERRKPVLEDEEILQLARWGKLIEKHYGRPMDMEWAKDGVSNKLFIVQARPETVQSQREAGVLNEFSLKEKGEELLTGLGIGNAIASGKVSLLKSSGDIDEFEENSILVTGMTDPDWVPIMKKAAGIITDLGGRTSHAAIVSRELGVPAVVGTENATQTVKDGREVTLSCTGGDKGVVYKGKLAYEKKQLDLSDIPSTETQIMLNIANPDAAFRWWRLPSKGVGLARMEFIVNSAIKIHPLALVNFEKLEDKKAKEKISQLTASYHDKTRYFADHLSRGIARIAAAQYPDEVIVRMSDFKTNEYADLIGGKEFEPEENNPMLGFRGASRYYSDEYKPGFKLECEAIKKVREEMGFDNVIIMIPFCRTLDEAGRVLKVLEENGLKQGRNNLKVYIMAEVPSNIILAREFARRFDGFSIGSNDLTQLTLGVDRDSAGLKYLFDERNEAVKRLISMLIQAAHDNNTKVGICGQAPSDYPGYAEFLVNEGIDSISLNPDSVIDVIKHVAELEKKR
ncbi:MAG: phosphoenolpyruvate synthase [Vulcanimicrobiota bacterium]